MYVSYRKSDQVFWTKTKHRMPQGETVLCDGENLARTRCGNRLSPKPQAPVASGNDPTEEALDIPDGPKTSLLAADPAPSVPEADFFVPANPAVLSSLLPPGGLNVPSVSQSGTPASGTGGPHSSGFYPGSAGPYFGNSLVYPNGAGSSSASAGPASAITDFGSGNALSTPEPSTLPLLFVGALLGSPTLVRRWRTRAATNRQK
jgi:hypothetical protein